MLGTIGTGGMATVYAVRRPRSEGVLALKVLTMSQSDSLRKRFTREAQLQRSIQHPNILPIFDVVQVSGQPALLLPFVAGPSLKTLLAQAPPSLTQRLALFREVVAGVAAVHDQELVHRDLKPGNVLLDTADGRLCVKVADFGIAKVFAADKSTFTKLTQTGMAIGTPSYMPPEQKLDASRVDARADVWALGAMLHELLIGGPPPENLNEIDLPEVPPWDALVRRLLSVDPADRPNNATVLLEELPPTEPLGSELYETCRKFIPVPAAGASNTVAFSEQQETAEEAATGPESSPGRHFEIAELLGSGGFGEVYRATMQGSGGLRRDVAVKFLRDPEPKALARLEREGKLLAALRHPTILEAYDLIRLKEQVALITEYVAGDRFR